MLSIGVKTAILLVNGLGLEGYNSRPSIQNSIVHTFLADLI